MKNKKYKNIYVKKKILMNSQSNRSIYDSDKNCQLKILFYEFFIFISIF